MRPDADAVLAASKGRMVLAYCLDPSELQHALQGASGDVGTLHARVSFREGSTRPWGVLAAALEEIVLQITPPTALREMAEALRRELGQGLDSLARLLPPLERATPRIGAAEPTPSERLGSVHFGMRTLMKGLGEPILQLDDVEAAHPGQLEALSWLRAGGARIVATCSDPNFTLPGWEAVSWGGKAPERAWGDLPDDATRAIGVLAWLGGRTDPLRFQQPLPDLVAALARPAVARVALTSRSGVCLAHPSLAERARELAHEEDLAVIARALDADPLHAGEVARIAARLGWRDVALRNFALATDRALDAADFHLAGRLATEADSSCAPTALVHDAELTFRIARLAAALSDGGDGRSEAALAYGCARDAVEIARVGVTHVSLTRTDPWAAGVQAAQALGRPVGSVRWACWRAGRWARSGRFRSEEALEGVTPHSDPTREAEQRLLGALCARLYTEPSDASLDRMAAITARALDTNRGGRHAHWLAAWSLLLSDRFGRADDALAFAERALQVNAAEPSASHHEETQIAVFGVLLPRTRPLSVCIEPLGSAARGARQRGDLGWAAYATARRLTLLFASGAPLTQVHQEAISAAEACSGPVEQQAGRCIAAIDRAVQWLSGRPPLLADVFEGSVARPVPLSAAQIAPLMVAAYVLEQDDTLASLSARIETSPPEALLPLSFLPDLWLFSAIAAAASFRRGAGPSRASVSNRVEDALTRLGGTHDDHRVHWLRAEAHWLQGSGEAAWYEFARAAECAAASGYVHHLGLIERCRGDFAAHSGWDEERERAHRAARRALAHWGVAIGDAAEPHRRSVDDVLVKLATDAVEHTGAQRGLLLVAQADGLYVGASASPNDATLASPAIPLASSRTVPRSVVDLVTRTGAPVLADAPYTSEAFTSDPVLQRRSPPSVLAVPIRRGGTTVGVVYLEGSSASCFTEHDATAVTALAAEAATSFDHAGLEAALAMLHRELEARVAARTREIEESRRRADASSEARAEFVATVSHEMRTPLNGILGMAELLADTGLDPALRAHVDGVDRAGHALLSVIDDTLAVSRLSAGTLRLEALPFSLRGVLNEALHHVASSALDKGIEPKLVVDEGVPDALMGDPVHIGKAVSNVLQHVVSSARPRAAVRLTARSDADGPWLVFHTDDADPLPESLGVVTARRMFAAMGALLTRIPNGYEARLAFAGESREVPGTGGPS